MISSLGVRKDDSMVCWSTVECWETVLGFVTEGCIVVSDRMLISILSMLVEPLKMSYAEAPPARDLKAEDLLSPLQLMCVFKKLNLSQI